MISADVASVEGDGGSFYSVCIGLGAIIWFGATRGSEFLWENLLVKALHVVLRRP